MYLITKEQLREIHEREGQGPNWYNHIAQIGSEDGIPIKTITHTPRHLEEVIPVKAYLDVIKKGIQETYPNLSETDIDVYLVKSFLTDKLIDVLRFLRSQKHGTSISKIGIDLNKGKSFVINLIQNLKELDLIKQDGSSIRADIKWDSDDAIYYTMPNSRKVIDRVLDSSCAI